MKRIIALLFLIGFLLPGSAHAADLANLLVNDKIQDLSFKYLQDIFGVVDGVLHGSGTQIMGQLFGAFNSAVLTLGFIIISYVFFVSTINTAHEGEVMGRKWSSIWIPLRIIASVAFIVPKGTGYCAIQIFVMSVVVSGVVAANKVMGAGLDYLKNGGVLIQSSPPPDTNQVKIAGNILKSLTCMNGIYNLVVNDAIDSKYNPLPTKFVPSTVSINTGGDKKVLFPSADAKYNEIGANFTGICGDVSWTAATHDNPYISPDGSTVTQDLRGIAVQQMILDLQPYSQQLADIIVPQKNIDGTYPITTQKLSDVVTANGISLILAAADYKGIMLPYTSSRAELFAAAGKKVVEDTAKMGWIMLGSLYFNLAQTNANTNGTDSAVNTNYKFTQQNGANSSAYSFINDDVSKRIRIVCDPDTDGASACDNVLTTTLADKASQSSGNAIDANIGKSVSDPAAAGKGLYKAGTDAKINATFGGAGGQIIQAILSPLIGPLYAIIYNMQALFDAENQNTDPIIAVSGLGSGLVNLVSQLWFGIAAAALSITIGVGVVPCVNPGGFGVLAFLSWFVPTFSALMIGMFVSGATMAFYVPLIPFILFTFAALGWFTAVLESMIAAPLVALGIASPEGHEIFGKAEPALMLLANVFLRPTLMVLGFFGGAILSHVGLWLLNKGYGVAWGWAVTSNLANLGIFGILWALVAGLVIYMSLVLAIINQTFGLIHQLPDEILRWLGGGNLKPLGASAGEALSTVKGNFEGANQAIGQGFQKSGEQFLEGQQQKGSSDGDVDLKGSKSEKPSSPPS